MKRHPDPALALTDSAASLPAVLALASSSVPTLESACAATLGFSVTDEASATLAAQGVAWYAAQRSELEAALSSAVDPIKAGLRVIESWLRPGIRACSAAEVHLKSTTQAWRRRCADEVAARLAAATSAEEIERACAAVATVPAGLVAVATWGWELDGDPIDPSYLVLDAARLDREARALKGALKVAGVRPVRSDTLRRSSH